MQTTAVETAAAYVFTVTEGEYTFTYEWGKQPPEGQTLEDYLQTCKRESELLAAVEIAEQTPPTPVKL